MIIYQFSQGRKEGVGEKKSMRNEYKRLEQKAIGGDRGGGVQQSPWLCLSIHLTMLAI
jgi:hypothetical protein